MKPASDLIYVRVLRNGYIPQLGICGPIPNPIQITRGKAYSMINDGIEVHEFDPKTKETTKLTVKNVFGDGASAPAPEVKVEEKKADEKAETPEVKDDNKKENTTNNTGKKNK